MENQGDNHSNSEVAEKLVEEYLEGNITSLIDLSQMLRDEAGITISKSTLARRLKGKVNVRTGRRRKSYFNRRSAVIDDLDDDEAYGYSYTLSRNLNETIVTVPVDEEHVRQYALVRVAGNGGKKYYRCNQCLKYRRTEKNTPQAYLIMEHGRIVGNKHHRHHPLCLPTRKVEATTTSLDRENRKDIRFGRKTPKAAYAEGFFKAIDIASTDSSVGNNALPKVYPQWSRVRKSYFRQNRLGRLDRAKSVTADGASKSGARPGEPILYAGYGEDGEYIIFEGEEIPEGYEAIPLDELDGGDEVLDSVWAAEQSAKNGGDGDESDSPRDMEDDENAELDVTEIDKSTISDQMMNQSEEPPLTLAELKNREERRKLSKSLIKEITSSPNFKKQPPRIQKRSFLSPSELEQSCFLPCNDRGELLVYGSDQLHLIEKSDGEYEIGYSPDIDLNKIIKNLKPFGILQLPE